MERKTSGMQGEEQRQKSARDGRKGTAFLSVNGVTKRRVCVCKQETKRHENIHMCFGVQVMCVCDCGCLYLCASVCIGVCVSLCVCVCVCQAMHVCVCLCLCVSLYLCVCVYLYM